MKVEATVDVGQNLTSMLEKLAQQIGVTVDTIFPWYVQQAQLHGITTLASFGLAIAVFAIVFSLSAPRAAIGDDNPNAAFFISIASGAALTITVVLMFLDCPRAVRQIINPNFYAMQMLADDIGKLRGR